MGWETDWNFIKQIGDGGQATVFKVQHKLDNTYGALKLLLDDSKKKRERRNRFAREIMLLKSITSYSIPKVFESNETCYEDTDVELYMVCEFIEGNNLSQYCSCNALSIDIAFNIVMQLLDAVDTLHLNEIIHRDIKPENIMVRSINNNVEIFLIDLGIAYKKNGNDDEIFDTETQQGLGNRFLELPELKPGPKYRDIRTDITYLVGILFYLVTGCYPRLLLNANNKMPHEALDKNKYSKLLADSRWSKLCRIFHIGFQYNIELRFKTIHQFREMLNGINSASEDFDSIENEINNLNVFIEQSAVKEIEQLYSVINLSMKNFCDEVNSALHTAKLHIDGGPGLKFDNKNKVCKSEYFLRREGRITPTVYFRLSIEYKDYRLTAYYILKNNIPIRYFDGAWVDSQGMYEANKKAANDVARQMLKDYEIALKAEYNI